MENLEIPVAILLLIVREETSFPVNIEQKTADAKGIIKTSFMQFRIMKLLSINRGLLNTNMERSSMQVPRIMIRAMTGEKMSTFAKRPVLTNLQTDDLNAQIMRVLPFLPPDS
jgi:hypothetical protein